jgi:hypothetical protein
MNSTLFHQRQLASALDRGQIIINRRRNNVMMENKVKAGIIRPLYQWFVVSKFLIVSYTHFVQGQRFKKSQSVPHGFTEGDQEHHGVLSEQYFEDCSDLEYLGAVHFGDYHVASPICGSSYDHLVTQLISWLNQRAEV